MIVSAEISHYKSIFDAHLKFSDRNIIVGPNGSGKSNILDALYFLRDCARDDIDTAVTKRHGIDSIRQWSRTKPYNITIAIRFNNSHGTGYYRVVISSSKGHYRIIEESGWWNGPHPRERFRENPVRKNGYSSFFRQEDGSVSINSPFSDLNPERPIRSDPDDLFLTTISGRLSISPYILFRPIGDELSSFFKYNIYPNTLRNPQLVSKENTLSEDGSNLASVLKQINSNKRTTRGKNDILSGINYIMPHVVDFQVKSAGGFYVPVLRVEEPNGDLHDFNLSQISDGTLRALGLLTAFYQPSAPEKIGIEEPEQMIHPGALPILAEAATDFVERRSGNNNRQVFITTHSPTLLDNFPADNIIWARFRKGVTEAGTISHRQLDLVKRQLFSPGEILLTEGFF